ncbi:hypothetical protein [Ahrensia sp. 13_GOM-1096m]|uniref:hypothetical protein n=1 Tax=Ahrensia sp. 13_GOM-1096m TaxID=1380380 RepID=UPI00047CDEE5|nr:hypothetical protein [Ahrensia sp. 13_GOM-1096m]
MINWLKPHDGHDALRKHLLKTGDNEQINITASGLISDDMAEQFGELQLLAKGARTSNPFFHMFASPSLTYSEKDWEFYWAFLEEEFGLEAQPYIEVEHVKFGAGGRLPPHKHRLYLRILPNGKCISDSHSAARIHKVARLSEIAAGETLTDGPYNASIVKALEAEGKLAVAEHLKSKGFEERVSSTKVSPDERAEAKRRKDIAPKEIIRRAYAAWALSDTGRALDQSLQNHGLLLFEGRNGRPMVLTPGGAEKRLASLINSGSSAEKGSKPRLKDLLQKLGDMQLRTRAKALSLHNILGLNEEHDASVTGITHRALLAEVPPTVPDIVDDDEGTIFTDPTEDAASFTEPPQAAPVFIAPQPLIEPVIRTVLTDAQIAAIEAFEEDLDGGAEMRVKQLIAEQTAESKKRVQQQERAVRRARRLATEGCIGQIGFAEIFKAKLAGVPAEYGAQIRWVQSLPGPVKQIQLKTGAALVSTPNLITSPNASIEAMKLMVAYAIERQWDPVEVTGGSLAWQAAIKQIMRDQGLNIAGEESTIAEPAHYEEHDEEVPLPSRPAF